MSTSSLGSTLKFNLDHPAGDIRYDNYIVGAAYNRDFYKLGYGFTLGAEVGIADRFGYYALCCNPIAKSSTVLNSGELRKQVHELEHLAAIDRHAAAPGAPKDDARRRK